MKLVVGLGNPESDYRGTYHNVGFAALDRLAMRLRAPDFAYDKKSNAKVCEVTSLGEKTLLVKPQTYMNLSGDAVAYLARYYKLPPENILVIYDDIDIPKGTVRARLSGSAGTHNGMRDIVNKLGSTGFARVRVGIGFKPEYMQLSDYVLSRPQAAWQNVLDKAYSAAADFAEAWLLGKPWQTLTVTTEI